MANPKTRLGRGLGGLISGAGASAKKSTGKAPVKSPAKQAAKKSAAKKAASTPVQTGNGYSDIPVQSIVANPYQPRREINPQHVEELAKSIRSEGLLQPVVVRAKAKGYELIAGERRLHAFKHLGNEMIPARIIEASDASSATLALIENLQRENLNPIDEALGYASLVRDFDLTQEAAAERVGKGRATVANAMRLLALNKEIQGYLSRRLLSTGHAKVLLGLEQDDYRTLLARRIIETGMSVREAEQQVRKLKEGTGSGTKSKTTKAEAQETVIRDLEKRIGDHFNTRVSLKHSPKKGKLTIEYYGNDDLDRILEKLGVGS